MSIPSKTRRVARLLVVGVFPVVCFGCRDNGSTLANPDAVSDLKDAMHRVQSLASFTTVDDRAAVDETVSFLSKRSRYWVRDVRGVWFDERTELPVRLWAGIVLADLGDRQAFEEIMACADVVDAPALPTVPAIEILGRGARRADIPQLIELLDSQDPWWRLTSAWSLFVATGNFNGSPDLGTRDCHLKERWGAWWNANGRTTKTEWFRLGITQSMEALQSGGPMDRVRAANRLRAIAAGFDPKAWLRPARHEAWQRWWDGTASGLLVDEHWCVSRGFPHSSVLWIFNWSGNEYWDAQEATFEAAKKRQLLLLLSSIEDGSADVTNVSEGLSMLTNEDYGVLESEPGNTELPGREAAGEDVRDALVRDAWRAYGRRAKHGLHWDWQTGHFVLEQDE